MRIITGDFKGRKLETPLDRSVRPTSDKVREAVFDVIMNDIYGSLFCDLFAGTGAMGLEALSRGASRCYFCDSERSSIAIIKRNIDTVGASDRSVVFFSDYMKALGKIREKVDVFFLDPPYGIGLENKALEEIVRLDLLDDEGIIILEQNADSECPEPEGLELIKTKKYGKTRVHFYRRSE